MTAATARTALVRAAALVALLSATAARGGEASNPAEAARGILIGTGVVTGVYYQAANAICRLVERDKRPDQQPVRQSDQPAEPVLPCGAMMTGGSVFNVAALRARSVDAALIQSDILDHAVHGTGSFQGRANDGLRALFSLHKEPFQFLVLRSLGLGRFDDLKGRKVNAGERGSATDEAFAALMRRHDLTETAFSQMRHLPVPDQFSAFCDGDVEALGMLVGAPFAPYRHAIEHCGGALLDLDEPADRALIADTPAYAPAVVPAGTYPGLDREVVTFGVVAVAVVTADMPEGIAYRIVRDVFERIDDLRAMHPVLAALDPRRMTADGITAPLHPGAARYFREKGWLP